MTNFIDRDKLIEWIETMLSAESKLGASDDVIKSWLSFLNHILSLPSNTESREVVDISKLAEEQADLRYAVYDEQPEHEAFQNGFSVGYNQASSLLSQKDKEIEELRKVIDKAILAASMQSELIATLKSQLSHTPPVAGGNQCTCSANHTNITPIGCCPVHANKSNLITWEGASEESSHTKELPQLNLWNKPLTREGEVCASCNGKRIWKENNSVIVCSECFGNDNKPESKPLTISEAKDEVARNNNFKSWRDAIKYGLKYYYSDAASELINKMCNEAILLYNTKQNNKP